MANENITQHFRKNEQIVIQRFESIIDQVMTQYSPYITNFLDPRECYILSTLVNRTELKVSFSGGFLGAERKRALIYPNYFEPLEEDFEFKFYNIKYAHKFNQLKHQQILGSLLGKGIKREQIGDIINEGVIWQFTCTKQIGQYLEQEITKMGRVPVVLEEIGAVQKLQVRPQFERKRLTINSLRLDNIIANVYNISRQMAKQLVQSERCKVNFAVIDDPGYKIIRGDVISVRGYGRFYLDDLEGMTKKGRNIIQITKFK